MSPGLVATAVLVVAAAIASISTRDGRTRVLALAVVSLLVPVLAEPLPEALPLAAQLAAIVLGLFALWVSVRVRPSAELASPLGWPVAACVALTCIVAGLAALVPFGERPGPLVAQAVGLALIGLAAWPVASGTGALRMGGGLILFLDGAIVLSNWLAGTPTGGAQVVMGTAFLGLAAGVALLRLGELRAGEALDVADLDVDGAVDGARPAR